MNGVSALTLFSIYPICKILDHKIIAEYKYLEKEGKMNK